MAAKKREKPKSVLNVDSRDEKEKGADSEVADFLKFIKGQYMSIDELIKKVEKCLEIADMNKYDENKKVFNGIFKHLNILYAESEYNLNGRFYSLSTDDEIKKSTTTFYGTLTTLSDYLNKINETDYDAGKIYRYLIQLKSMNQFLQGILIDEM